MNELVSVTRGNATIEYELVSDDKAALIYKRMRGLADMLDKCEDYEQFHALIKKLKPNEDFIIKKINSWNDSGLMVSIQKLANEDTEDEEEDELDASDEE